MTAKTITETVEAEKIVDDISTATMTNDVKPAIQSEAAINMNKLADLRAKQQAKQLKDLEAKKPERSIRFNIIGSGQCGNRLAEYWGKIGYKAIAINTAGQDLKHINLPDSAKCLLKQEFQGASKELSIGAMAAETNRQAIIDCIKTNLTDGQVNIIATSCGGGSGAGSIDVLIDILSEMGKPIIVQAVLPMDSDDVLTKQNTLETLQKLAGYARDKKIANLILIDNAKIEHIYQGVSSISFYEVANKAMIDPLDAFNRYSSMPSSMKGIDDMECLKLLIDGEGLTSYGYMEVKNFHEDTAIAECVINSLDSNLLAAGMNLKTAKYCGFMVIASTNVWKSIPASSPNYALAVLNEVCQPKSTFKGMYVDDGVGDDKVLVYSLFSGMGLPESRVNALKEEVVKSASVVKNKEETRNLNLKLDTGDATISQAQKIKDKITAKNSTFGRMTGGNTVIDRRK
jgi:cell division GTPase FtsZ